MINFEHYIEFNKKFEDVLTKLKEDGEIFNTQSFGKIEECIIKWLNNYSKNITKDDLRILSTYLTSKVLKPEHYFKELRFLHEEIRLRNLVESYMIILPLFELITYISHYVLKDPKKGLTDKHFIGELISSIGEFLNKENFNNILSNIKAKNYKDPEVTNLLNNIKSSTELL